ncbi:unnamed protein product, partial [Urochloa humidicola]
CSVCAAAFPSPWSSLRSGPRVQKRQTRRRRWGGCVPSLTPTERTEGRRLIALLQSAARSRNRWRPQLSRSFPRSGSAVAFGHVSPLRSGGCGCCGGCTESGGGRGGDDARGAVCNAVGNRGVHPGGRGHVPAAEQTRPGLLRRIRAIWMHTRCSGNSGIYILDFFKHLCSLHKACLVRCQCVRSAQRLITDVCWWVSLSTCRRRISVVLPSVCQEGSPSLA